MPRVPVLDNFSAQPTTAPNVRVQNQMSGEMASLPGRQLQQFGESVQKAGQTGSEIALDIQKRANDLRVADARNQGKEAFNDLIYGKEGFYNLRGRDALERPDGKPLAEEYSAKLQERFSKIAESLGNDYQKQEFGLQANEMLTTFKNEATQHEGAQFREYTLSVREGSIKNDMNDVGLNYNKPDVVNKAIESIKVATYDMARMQGKSAEWAEAKTREMTSAAHQTAIAAALEKGNVKYADEYLKKYAKDMSADDILKADGLVTKEMDVHLANQTVSEVLAGNAPQLDTSDTDRAFNILIGQESGGKQFDKNGQPLTSSAGAVGIAQIMRGTGPEAAKLAGLPWDENKWKNDAQYNRALGKAYFTKQLRDFGGSLAKAYAAYNAGPGATLEAIAKAEKDGGNWLAYLPQETQDYVSKNMTRFESGAGQHKKPTLFEMQQQVREKLGNERPERLRMALDELDRQYKDIEAATKQRGEEAVATAMREVMSNGGRFTDLAPSVRAAIPPESVTKVMDFAKRYSQGDDTTSLLLYDKLATDQNYLKNLSEAQFFALRSELSDSDFKKFSDKRAELITGQGANGAGSLNTEAINSTLNDRLRTMGIDPTDKKKGERVGAIRKFVNESIAAAQAASGKKMTDVETSQFIDGLFAKNSVYDGFFGSSSGPMLGMKVGDIDNQVRKKLEAAFKKAGVDDPSDADILNAYWRMLTIRKGAK